MTREELEDRVLNLVKDSLPFNEYIHVASWLDSHRKVEDLYSKIDRLYKFGVSEIRTSMIFDTKCDITAKVANALIDEIKKPLLEEIAKQKEILDILKPYFSIDYDRDCPEPYRLYILGDEETEITEEQYETLKEWKENE